MKETQLSPALTLVCLLACFGLLCPFCRTKKTALPSYFGLFMCRLLFPNRQHWRSQRLQLTRFGLGSFLLVPNFTVHYKFSCIIIIIIILQRKSEKKETEVQFFCVSTQSRPYSGHACLQWCLPAPTADSAPSPQADGLWAVSGCLWHPYGGHTLTNQASSFLFSPHLQSLPFLSQMQTPSLPSGCPESRDSLFAGTCHGWLTNHMTWNLLPSWEN